MKVLLDENLPHELRFHLMPMHDVFTVSYLGWSSYENGELLAKATAESFDVMITVDQGIEHQQNMTNLPLSVVILKAATNKIDDIRPLVARLLAELATLKPRTLVRIG